MNICFFADFLLSLYRNDMRSIRYRLIYFISPVVNPHQKKSDIHPCMCSVPCTLYMCNVYVYLCLVYIWLCYTFARVSVRLLQFGWITMSKSLLYHRAMTKYIGCERSSRIRIYTLEEKNKRKRAYFP